MNVQIVQNDNGIGAMTTNGAIAHIYFGGNGLLPVGQGEIAAKSEFDEERVIDNKAMISSRDTGKRKGAHRSVERQKWLQNRVPYTYTELIAMAIKAQPDMKATLAEIYDFLRDNFDCFRGHYTGWKNCIRHTLTLAKSFQKEARTARTGRAGIGNYWTLSDYFHQRHLLKGGRYRASRNIEAVQEQRNIGYPTPEKESERIDDEEDEKEMGGREAGVGNTPNGWEQQQSKDVEELLRKIGIPKTEKAEERGTKFNGNMEGRQEKQQTRTTATITLVEGNDNSAQHATGTFGQVVAQQQLAQRPDNTKPSGISRVRSGTKLELLLAKMTQLRNKQSVVVTTTTNTNNVVHEQQSPDLLRPSSMAQLEQFLMASQSAPSTSSTPTTTQKVAITASSLVDIPQQQQPAGSVEDEVITVDDEEEIDAEGGAEPKGPSMASIAQMSAWLGLVAGEMRLRLQCDGKNGAMVLSPRNQGRNIHRLQFIPVNDTELDIRQFIGDQLYQENRWTWTERQEEQILYAIRGICFHFFFCR